LEGHTLIVVDDGAATGASMRVAVVALRQLEPQAIIVALPTASRQAVSLLREAADECIALVEPEPFYGVGASYQDFSEVSDDQVRAALAGATSMQGHR
jgi:predicted phosphoribosyltransferase